MSARDQQFIAFAPDFEIQTHRLVAEAANINRHFQQIIEPGRMMEIAFQVDPGQPDVELFKHYGIRQIHRAKQFRLSNFKKTDIGAVENYARGVDVAPADSIFDGVFLVLGQVCFDQQILAAESRIVFAPEERDVYSTSAYSMMSLRYKRHPVAEHLPG